MRHAGEPADYDSVLREVVAVATGAQSAPGSAAGAANASGQALKPNLATTNPGLLGTNVLHEIDHAAQVGGWQGPGQLLTWRRLLGDAGRSSTQRSYQGCCFAANAAAVVCKDGGMAPTPTYPRPAFAAQVVVNAISEAQAQAGGGPAGALDLGPGAGKLQLDRVITLAGGRRCGSCSALAAAAERLFLRLS